MPPVPPVLLLVPLLSALLLMPLVALTRLPLLTLPPLLSETPLLLLTAEVAVLMPHVQLPLLAASGASVLG
jgi:hypothetical protein